MTDERRVTVSCGGCLAAIAVVFLVVVLWQVTPELVTWLESAMAPGACSVLGGSSVGPIARAVARTEPAKRVTTTESHERTNERTNEEPTTDHLSSAGRSAHEDTP